jgi:hypothetical protein
MANHKLSIDTTQDPCKFSLDSTFKRQYKGEISFYPCTPGKKILHKFKTIL